MSNAHCCKSKPNLAFVQTLDEMDFERGIWSAAADGNRTKVEFFLHKGIQVDVLDSVGHTALHHAALNGHLNICELLLKFGADINAVTKAGKATSLHRAATAGKTDVVELLVNHGACLTLQDADGQTALHRAYINNHPSIADFLSLNCPELLTIVDNKAKFPQDYGQI